MKVNPNCPNYSCNMQAYKTSCRHDFQTLSSSIYLTKLTNRLLSFELSLFCANTSLKVVK